jgi:hypothetical protein
MGNSIAGGCNCINSEQVDAQKRTIAVMEQSEITNFAPEKSKS